MHTKGIGIVVYQVEFVQVSYDFSVLISVYPQDCTQGFNFTHSGETLPWDYQQKFAGTLESFLREDVPL